MTDCGPSDSRWGGGGSGGEDVTLCNLPVLSMSWLKREKAKPYHVNILVGVVDFIIYLSLNSPSS